LERVLCPNIVDEIAGFLIGITESIEDDIEDLKKVNGIVVLALDTLYEMCIGPC